MCRAYYSNPFLAQVARESIDILRDFESWSGGGYSDYRTTGLLFLHPPEDAADLGANARMLEAVGTRVELLEPDRIADLVPGIDASGLGPCVWEPLAGPADPSSTTLGLLAMAKAGGAVTSLYNAARLIELRQGGGVRLTTDEGVIEADRLLIAAGPWTRELALQLDVDLPLTVERHYVTTNDWGTAEPIRVSIADIVNGFYLVGEGATRFGLGQLFDEPAVDPDHFSEHVTADEQLCMAGAAARRMPALMGARAAGGWASLYDVSPDWQPVIGEIAPDVFVDAGTSGHGFKLAPVLGRHVADLVLDGVPTPGLEQFHPSRFTTGTEIKGGYGRARILG
jgi:glycine/D-amino acid oxidase-like deaminating enzyme